MSTSIEWTQRPGTKGETWNPTTGCNKVSQGCKNCYAEVMHRRLAAMGQRKYSRAFNTGVVTHPDTLTLPLKWKQPRTVFVNSMSDLFHADVPFNFIDQVFAIMALTPQHTYQILTKRPERMAEYTKWIDPKGDGTRAYDRVDKWGQQMNLLQGKALNTPQFVFNPLPNVWLGTSVEDQAAADARIPHLLRTPAAVRFLSCEPLLGPLDISWWMKVCKHWKSEDRAQGGGPPQYPKCWYEPQALVLAGWKNPIHWVITGGESGHHARPMHPDWARSLRDQCAAAGVPFFFKQWGTWLPASQGEAVGIRATMVKDGCEWDAVGKHASGNLLDGRTHQEYPSASPSPSSRGMGANGADPSRGDTLSRASGDGDHADPTAQGAEQLTHQ